MTHLFYFIGGPIPGKAEEFFTRLKALGGSPPGWRLFPHASGDGKALHLVEASSTSEITAHLNQFAGVYAHGPIIEVTEAPSR